MLIANWLRPRGRYMPILPVAPVSRLIREAGQREEQERQGRAGGDLESYRLPRRL